MKYLKKFENREIFSSIRNIKREEFQDFCENYLAYLLDDHIKILSISKPILLQTNKYMLYNVEMVFYKDIFWEQIKDHFITFLEMVKKFYGFREHLSGKMCSIAWQIEDVRMAMSYSYTFEELLKEKIEKFPIEINLGKIDGRVNTIKLEIVERFDPST